MLAISSSKKLLISLGFLLISALRFLPSPVFASGDILLDTMTGNTFNQLIYPHYGFTPVTSGTLESIDVAWSTATNTTYDFTVNLEYPFFIPIDCVSSLVPGTSGNDSSSNSIITSITGFHGKDCALTSGQPYGIDFGGLKGFGGIWGDALLGGGFGIYRGTLPPTCSDGIQNQNETGVDTGGICDTSNALLDDFTGKGFDHEIAPHWQFTPTKSGVLTSIMGYFSSTYRGPDPTGAHLETAEGFSLDCNALEHVDYNGLGLHTILNGWTNFTGSECYLEAGVSYQMKLDVTQIGGVWVSDSSNVSHPKVIYYGTPTTVCTVDCFSNVLFLPGIKGSVLKTGSDTLWPPTIFSTNDIAQLALTEGGESVNDIYTTGILNKFYTTKIYEPFSNFMDDLVAGQSINKWLPLAYDWRFSPEKVLSDGIKTETGVINVVNEVERLASESKSGKVAIVAHSMGGLLGKAIIKKLTEEGKDNLIDSFVMVGTPQLGTPQAMATILHGDGESHLLGFVTNPIGIRRIAQNMPSAYNLLPSFEYFNKVPDPVIKFDTQSTFTQTWRNLWGQAINTYSNFTSFLTGGNGVRTKPADNILSAPEVLRSDLVASASSFHDEYDTYEFPEHIRVVQVAGWGIPTTKAIEYKTSHGRLSYNLDFTVEGDKTVVYPSAVSSVADETYYFNISLFNKDASQNIQHRDILNSTSVKEIIRKAVESDSILETNYISTTKPPITETDTQLIVSTHSPVILSVHDQFGNLTGIDPMQDLSAEVLSIKEDIPGSTFIYTSESQHIFLPKNGVYNFIYKGTGSGLTTVTIDNFIGDVETPIVSYTDIPTTVNTEATFTVQSDLPKATEIELDINGNGNTQTIFADGAELSIDQIIKLIKEKIQALSAKDKLKKTLLKRVEDIEKKIEKKKGKGLKIIEKLHSKITKKELKGKIDAASATNILYLLDLLEASIKDVI